MIRNHYIVSCAISVIYLIGCLCFVSVPHAWGFDQQHTHWTTTLKKYQNKLGFLKYKELKKDTKVNSNHEFNFYLKEIFLVSLSTYNSWKKEEQEAFLINAYNALTVKLILENYPVKSINEIGSILSSPWKKKFFKLLEGQIESLDPIEHQWLRPQFKDYRLHAALNCASFSCPTLRSEAYVASQLNDQLNDQMKKWVNDPQKNIIDRSGGIFKLSKIFSWYKEDFEEWGGGVKEVINRFLVNPLSKDELKKVNLKKLDYNWDLNEAK